MAAEFPPCRWAREPIGPDRRGCVSPKLVTGPRRPSVHLSALLLSGPSSPAGAGRFMSSSGAAARGGDLPGLPSYGRAAGADTRPRVSAARALHAGVSAP